jgi:hypothetical protein
VPAGKIVMSQLEKVVERVETFECIPEKNGTKKSQRQNQEANKFHEKAIKHGAM